MSRHWKFSRSSWTFAHFECHWNVMKSQAVSYSFHFFTFHSGMLPSTLSEWWHLCVNDQCTKWLLVYLPTRTRIDRTHVCGWGWYVHFLKVCFAFILFLYFFSVLIFVTVYALQQPWNVIVSEIWFIMIVIQATDSFRSSWIARHTVIIHF